ncbi:hypothetical protein SAMN02745135_01148 [Caloranaerobacter azorensis DSM 13643]|uniref:MazG nucleotide pyrophosphohydrolase domain-containing protein n=1 Tax=Caloranaerobacter azorensis DSM 13643 TaxID=1121264 RepID=A0A1M5TV88_9FIRM|nr:nucleotide pyrophosphohydrolase [Caloranaerobacter azorensis]SHH54516.1 hypothetical protein SAMN02745135_01148 [Caloranaerobacter azorensis DSM 13643]
MEIILPVLDKKEDWAQHQQKLKEEFKELSLALATTNIYGEEAIENIAEEALDVIQVCIGILDRVNENNPRILKNKIQRHVVKLVNRGWKFKEVLRVVED